MNLCILIDCCVILFYFYFFHFFCGPRVDYREILSFTLNKQSFIINHYHYLLLLSECARVPVSFIWYVFFWKLFG